jgi:hypothetical protein
MLQRHAPAQRHGLPYGRSAVQNVVKEMMPLAVDNHGDGRRRERHHHAHKEVVVKSGLVATPPPGVHPTCSAKVSPTCAPNVVSKIEEDSLQHLVWSTLGVVALHVHCLGNDCQGSGQPAAVRRRPRRLDSAVETPLATNLQRPNQLTIKVGTHPFCRLYTN